VDATSRATKCGSCQVDLRQTSLLWNPRLALALYCFFFYSGGRVLPCLSPGGQAGSQAGRQVGRQEERV